jgi:hypothetical protein
MLLLNAQGWQKRYSLKGEKIVYSSKIQNILPVLFSFFIECEINIGAGFVAAILLLLKIMYLWNLQ